MLFRSELRGLAEKADRLIVHHEPQFNEHKKKNTGPPQQDNKSTLCWYHARFADRATRCEEPCAWPEN